MFFQNAAGVFLTWVKVMSFMTWKEDIVLVYLFFVSHSEFMILESDTSLIQMAVWKQHGANPPEPIIEQIKKKAKELFGDAITFRMKMRKIPSH